MSESDGLPSTGEPPVADGEPDVLRVIGEGGPDVLPGVADGGDPDALPGVVDGGEGEAPRARRGREAMGRRVILWDVGVSIIVMLLGSGLAVFLGMSALLLVMNADACLSSACDAVQLNAGWLVASIAPALVMLVAIVLAVVRMVRRRVSFWIPLAGIAVAVVAWFVGVLLVFESVPGIKP